jgi:hypothetical protein
MCQRAETGNRDWRGRSICNDAPARADWRERLLRPFRKEVAVRRIVPAAFGIWLTVAQAGVAWGQDRALEPGRLNLETSSVSANQQLATTIAARLQNNAHLRHYHVDIQVAEGTAELTGHVADAAQRDEVVRTVQAVPGIERVRDGLSLRDAQGVVNVQAENPVGQPGRASTAMPPEPTPIFQGHPGTPNPSLQPPPLPPNAWPTYAPYNNYSRVGYPTLYPYEAWPFIGPQYPFPKVPLGWRAVTLRWQDGYWFYGREAGGHDWWRIRYW